MSEVGQDRTVVVLPANHPLAGKRRVTLAALENLFFVGMSEKTHPGFRDRHNDSRVLQQYIEILKGLTARALSESSGIGQAQLTAQEVSAGDRLSSWIPPRPPLFGYAA